MFIGVLANEPTSGEVMIGTAEFAVDSAQPVTVTEADFDLITGDVLVAPSGQAPNSVQSRLSLVGRRVSFTPPKFENALAQNYPNPFNPTTTVAFSLASAVATELRIYDVRGALVRTLVNDHRSAGVHRVEWNGRDDGGQMVASGVYFCKLVAGRFTDTKKLTVLK
jgi:flagellar hook assembly protein FlgD